MTALAAERDSLATQLNLSEVEVTAAQPVTATHALRLLATIDREDIAALPATTVADLLQTLPGVDIRTRGANGGQADISLRGGTFDQVRVLLNGVNITDAQTGHYSLNLPVPLEAIRRVELLDGAINIVTLQPDSDQYNVAMQAGMNKFAKAELLGGWQRNNWRVLVSADYAHSSGYGAPAPSEKEKTALKNTDFDMANIYINAAWKGFNLQAGAQYKDIGAGSFYGFGSQDQFDATRTAFAAARYSHEWGRWSLDVQADYRCNHDRYEWHRGTISNKHLTHNTTGIVRAHYSSSVGKTTIGAEVRDEYIRSTNFGTHNRLNVSYFAQQTFHVQGFSAVLSGNGIYNTSFGHHWAASADLNYAFDCGVTLFANANRTVRMPTFTDLYYNAGFQLGDPDMKPEKMWTVSGGASYRHSFDRAGTLSASADVFHRWGRDIIDWVYVPADTKRPYHAANQQQVNTLGVECSVSYRLNEWLRCVQVAYAYTLLDIDLAEAQSRYLDYLRHKLVVHLEHGIYKGFGAAWTFSYRQRQGQFNDAEGLVQNYEPVCLLEGELYYQFPKWRITAECTNITNRHYYDYGGILQPGAWARLRVDVRL